MERSSEIANDPFLVGMSGIPSALSCAVSICQIVVLNITYCNLPASTDFVVLVDWPELVDRWPFPPLGVVPLSACAFLIARSFFDGVLCRFEGVLDSFFGI